MNARPLALALLLAATASAQPADPRHRAPGLEDGVVLALVATGTTIAAVSITSASAPTLTSTAAMGIAVLGTSSALGLRPTLPGVLLDTAIGGAAGVVTRELYLRTAESGPWTEIEAAAVGAAVGGAVASVAHLSRLRLLRGHAEIAPAALAAPTGEAGAGLSLTVRL